eukprot:TRINITY_DN3165_c0_g2_i2.p1 TRINITY_DN3165_c0_g2~~TRINITY_DN3165_c0_g2_i2.p1  ORF type:complete len:460 (+),score=44.42 TRINITY_DN3165_c0_g2_i2:360-1739(+)
MPTMQDLQEQYSALEYQHIDHRHSVPIAKLPIDLLQDIFRRSSQYDRMYKLPLVCKAWNRALQQPSHAWSDFTFAPSFFRGNEMEAVTRTKDEINYYRLMCWLRQRVGGMEIIRVSDRFCNQVNCARMQQLLLENLQYASKLKSMWLAFKSPTILNTFLPEGIENLQQLSTLKLETWNVQFSPHHLAQLAALKSLKSLTVGALFGYGDEEDVPFLVEFPREVCFLPLLEELVLRSRGVTHVPKEISLLKNLRLLNLEGCMISALPLCMLHLTNLEHLNLSKNRIEHNIDEIAETAFSIPNLKVLNLAANHIKELPIPNNSSRLRASKLQHLDLSSNQLTLLPRCFAKLGNLRELLLNRNAFMSFPTQVRKMKALRRLEMVGCQDLVIENKQQLEYDLQHIPFLKLPSFDASFIQVDLGAEEDGLGDQPIGSNILKLASKIQNLAQSLANMLPEMDVEWL